MARKRNDLALSSGTSQPAARRTTVRRTTRTTSAVSVAVPVETPVPMQVEAAPALEPSREEIAALAYSYWESRRGEVGSPEEDWLRAERELRARVAV